MDLSPFNIIVGTDGVPAEKVADAVFQQLPDHTGKKKPAPKRPASRKKKKAA